MFTEIDDVMREFRGMKGWLEQHVIGGGDRREDKKISILKVMEEKQMRR